MYSEDELENTAELSESDDTSREFKTIMERLRYEMAEEKERKRKRIQKIQNKKQKLLHNVRTKYNKFEKELDDIEKIKNPTLKELRKRIFNMMQGNWYTKPTSTDSILIDMEADYAAREFLLRRILGILNEKYTDTRALLRVLFKLSPKIAEGVWIVMNPRRERSWIENWKENKSIILRPPFKELNLDVNTDKFKDEISDATKLPNNVIFQVKQSGDLLSNIGTVHVTTLHNIFQRVERSTVNYFNIMRKLDIEYKSLNEKEEEGEVNERDTDDVRNLLISNVYLFEDTDAYINIINEIPGKFTKESILKLVKEFNSIFIKDVIYHIVKPYYSMNLIELNNIIIEFNKNIKKNVDIVEQARCMLKSIKKLLKQSETEKDIKFIFKKQHLSSIAFYKKHQRGDKLIFEYPSTYDYVPDFKNSSQQIEYWTPYVQLQTGAPVNKIKEEIKYIKDTGVKIYLKLSKIQHGNETIYYYRKFIDFSDFLMAWYNRYTELMELTKNTFYADRIRDIRAYFESNLNNPEFDKDKLSMYILMIQEFIKNWHNLIEP